GAPTAVRKVLMRGLEMRPEERWPSMVALLEALQRAPRRRLKRWVLGVASVGVLGVGGLALHMTALAQAQPCTDAAQDLAEVWDEARSAEVKDAILGLDRSYATDVWTRTELHLDEYAGNWATAHSEVCESGAQDPKMAAELLDRRMQCLHRAAAEFRATVETLADADAQVVLRAHELTAGLPPLSKCADPESMTTEVEPPDPQQAPIVEDARVELARAKTLMRAGRYELAKQAVGRARGLVEPLAYGPLLAEVALQEGIVLDRLGKYETSEDALEEALMRATQQGQLGSMATAAHHLMFVVGYRQRRMEEGLSYRPLVEGLARHEPLGEADSLSDLAIVLEAGGQYEQAEAQHRAVLSQRREHLGPDHPHVVTAQTYLANVLRIQGRYQEAQTEYGEALSIRQRTLGPQHPLSAASHNDLGNVLVDQGRYAEAEVQFRAALAFWQDGLGPDHPNVAMARNNLCSILHTQGKYAEAEAELRDVLVTWQEALGPRHPNIGLSRNNLGKALSAQGKHEPAEVEFRAALSLLEELRGPRDPDAVMARRNLAYELYEQGKYEESEAEHRVVLAARLETLNPDHAHIAQSRTDLAEVLLELERTAEAVPLAKQAWIRRQHDDVPTEERAQTAFALARALWKAQQPVRNRPRATRLAEDALQSYRISGDAYVDDVDKVQRWLAARG
ncbi:MAG: tetratricopeptide repeat protein, partial [Nannocystaceae bacterium]